MDLRSPLSPDPNRGPRKTQALRGGNSRHVRLLRELAIMLVERADMPGLNVDTATETVEKVLREHALNGALFKSLLAAARKHYLTPKRAPHHYLPID